MKQIAILCFLDNIVSVEKNQKNLFITYFILNFLFYKIFNFMFLKNYFVFC